MGRGIAGSFFVGMVRGVKDVFKGRVFPLYRISRYARHIQRPKSDCVFRSQSRPVGTGSLSQPGRSSRYVLFRQTRTLQNIFKELNDDLGIPIPKTGYLKPWADQGVLLLNTILTVRRGEAYSHKGMGWERLTDLIIEKLNDRKDPVIFLLWGAPARQKKALITNPWHYVLEAPHPSPLSAYSGYFGCKHFSKANAILFSLGKAPIDWRIE